MAFVGGKQYINSQKERCHVKKATVATYYVMSVVTARVIENFIRNEDFVLVKSKRADLTQGKRFCTYDADKSMRKHNKKKKHAIRLYPVSARVLGLLAVPCHLLHLSAQ